jgi:hypothetical protein
VALLIIPSIAVEHGNTKLWYGRIIELLGTHARATNKVNLLSEIKAELSYHLLWLRRRGERTGLFDTENLKVKEEVEGIHELGKSGGEVALFNFDRQEVDDRILRTAIRCMGYNRLDLLDVCINLDDA